MKRISFLSKNVFKLLLLLIIGLGSLAVVFLKTPVNSFYAAGNKVETSGFAINIYDKSANVLFSVSPLNDYYYQGPIKDHLENKLVNSNSGNLIQQAILNFQALILNKKSLVWNTEGNNGGGKVIVNYTVNSFPGKVEIVRKIEFARIQADSISESITICRNCLVADDKKRAYFNGFSITQQKIDSALRLNLIPVALGENQSFPLDVSKILILNANGKIQIEIPISKTQVFLQDNWNLLEIKSAVKKDSKIQLKQDIYIQN